MIRADHWKKCHFCGTSRKILWKEYKALPILSHTVDNCCAGVPDDGDAPTEVGWSSAAELGFATVDLIKADSIANNPKHKRAPLSKK